MSRSIRSTGGDTPSMAAGVALQRMQRHVRWGRTGAWGALACGPLALLVAVLPQPAAVQADVPGPKPERAQVAPADPVGYAEVFLRAWLRSDAQSVGSAQARLAQAMAPAVALPERAGAAQPEMEEVRTVRTVQRAHSTWSVTLAAQYSDGRVRYYAVPVVADRRGNSFVVSGAPAVIGGPARAKVPRLPYAVSVPDGALSSAAREFLAAYLTGAGEVSRYLAPGTDLSPLSPAPYTAVAVRQVLAAGKAAAADQVPADGTTVQVLVSVEAQDGGGRWPLAYELVFEARSGRWEISALQSGPAARPGGAR